MYRYILLISLIILSSCSQSVDTKNKPRLAELKQDKNFNYIQDPEPHAANGLVNAVIEIPAGSNEKWEVEKSAGALVHQLVNGQPRIIQFLPYPANYGMIPRSLLPKEKGGDGDPFDVIIVGPSQERGKIVPVKIIGVLRLVDRGETDDKLIAITQDSPLFSVNSLEELEDDYTGVLSILEQWFIHYKGPGKVVSQGYDTKENAMIILKTALQEYRTQAK